MNKKVTVRELISTQILLAVNLVVYYWSWARTDWNDYYATIHNSVGIFTFLFFVFQAYRMWRYRFEIKDEMADLYLKKVDSICMKIMLGVLVIFAWCLAITGHVQQVNASIIGWFIILLCFFTIVVRTILFLYMDTKGVYK